MGDPFAPPGNRGAQGGSDGEESAFTMVGDPGSFPGSGRPPGEGNGNPLQYASPENSMDGAWQLTVHGVAKNWICLSDFHEIYIIFISQQPRC